MGEYADMEFDTQSSLLFSDTEELDTRLSLLSRLIRRITESKQQVRHLLYSWILSLISRIHCFRLRSCVDHSEGGEDDIVGLYLGPPRTGAAAYHLQGARILKGGEGDII